MRRMFLSLLLVVALILPAYAQRVFISTVVVGMSTRSAGDYTFSAVTVPLDVRGLSITMNVSEADATLPAISAALEGSLDGGITWIPAGAFSRQAGPKGLNLLGQPVTVLGASFIGGDFWNATANANRRLRGSATIGGTMRFSMTVQPL